MVAGNTVDINNMTGTANTCLLNAVYLSQYVSDEIYLTNLTVKFVVVRL